MGNNYEINFHGVYRYRRPKNQLLAFESGIAFMEGGLITSLTTESVPNEYHLDWVNKLWRWYPLFCVGITFIALLIILFGKVEKSLLFDLIRKRVGLG